MVRELAIGSEQNMVFILIVDLDNDNDVDIFEKRFKLSLESDEDELLIRLFNNYDIKIDVTKFNPKKEEYIFHSKDLVEYIENVLNGSDKCKVLSRDKQVMVRFISFLTRKKPTAFKFVRMKVKGI